MVIELDDNFAEFDSKDDPFNINHRDESTDSDDDSKDDDSDEASASTSEEDKKKKKKKHWDAKENNLCMQFLKSGMKPARAAKMASKMIREMMESGDTKKEKKAKSKQCGKKTKKQLKKKSAKKTEDVCDIDVPNDVSFLSAEVGSPSKQTKGKKRKSSLGSYSSAETSKASSKETKVSNLTASPQSNEGVMVVQQPINHQPATVSPPSAPASAYTSPLEAFRRARSNITPEVQKSLTESFNRNIESDKYGFKLVVYNFATRNPGMDDRMTCHGVLVFEMHGPNNSRDNFWCHKPRAWQSVVQLPVMNDLNIPSYILDLIASKKRAQPNGPDEPYKSKEYTVDTLSTMFPPGQTPRAFATEFMTAFTLFFSDENMKWVRENYVTASPFGGGNGMKAINPKNGPYWSNLSNLQAMGNIIQGHSLKEYLMDSTIQYYHQKILQLYPHDPQDSETQYGIMRAEIADRILV